MSVAVQMIKPNVHPGFADFSGYIDLMAKAHSAGVDVSDVSALGQDLVVVVVHALVVFLVPMLK